MDEEGVISTKTRTGSECGSNDLKDRVNQKCQQRPGKADVLMALICLALP